MAENSKIEWCDSTWNPWVGCTKVSPGCDHCYAEAWDRRFAESGHAMHWGAGKARRRTSASTWRLPLRWNAKRFMECEACGWRGECAAELIGCGACGSVTDMNDARRRVFCASLADVFDNEVPEEWRADLFRLIEATPNLGWILLTKRIGNAADMMFMARGGHLPLLPNVWIGATVVTQAEADRDIPKLLNTPARVRFLSMEPLLGPVDLFSVQHLKMIDWVIVGGESGPKARPMHPDWVRSVRDQCTAAGVPFMFKQWGGWQIASDENGHYDSDMARNRAHWVHVDGAMTKPSCIRSDMPAALIDRAYGMVKVGKKAAGRLLDGREWNGFPLAKDAEAR